jgi:hypothetical protein
LSLCLRFVDVVKKAIIYVRLVRECSEKSKNELEKEISEGLSEHPITIPWLAEVEKVEVIEE